MDDGLGWEQGGRRWAVGGLDIKPCSQMMWLQAAFRNAGCEYFGSLGVGAERKGWRRDRVGGRVGDTWDGFMRWVWLQDA